MSEIFEEIIDIVGYQNDIINEVSIERDYRECGSLNIWIEMTQLGLIYCVDDSEIIKQSLRLA